MRKASGLREAWLRIAAATLCIGTSYAGAVTIDFGPSFGAPSSDWDNPDRSAFCLGSNVFDAEP
ncbi:MAG TPA: hypothetical protein PLL20_02455 [Phycisphaerae bacterium]|nr:hypothetical protein [Phycisphaerae bacterium]HRR83401.1 hypothetical protein [Phycisphaerae bacterium]